MTSSSEVLLKLAEKLNNEFEVARNERDQALVMLEKLKRQHESLLTKHTRTMEEFDEYKHEQDEAFEKQAEELRRTRMKLEKLQTSQETACVRKKFAFEC